MAIVEMFLMKVVKVIVDLQKLWISFSVVLFSGEMNPLDPISKGFTYTLWVSMSDTKWAYFSVLRVWAERMFGSALIL